MTGRPRGRTLACALAVVLGVAAPIVGHVSAQPRSPSRPAAAIRAGVHDASGPSSYLPVDACRLLDTRDGGVPLTPDTELALDPAGACGIADGAVALAMSVTVTDASSDGFVTVWPFGVTRPLASAVNFGAGETRTNGTVIELGATGQLTAWTSAATAHVVIDVTGVFVPAIESRAGRFVPLTQQRLLDTRESGAKVPAGGEVTVPLPGGVPADATALAVSIAVTEPDAPGFFTAYAAGTPRPSSSVVNTDASGQLRATGQIVPVSAGGFTIYSQAGAHVVVDVTGWFTGSSAARSATGLFVPLMPTRLADTRTVSRRVAALNWTMTDTRQSGFLTVHPARTELPLVATVNAATRRETVSQFGVTPTSTEGPTMYSNAGTQVLVDVTGWFTGSPRTVSADTAPAVNTPVPDTERRVLLMGDSTLAGVRWYLNSQHALGGANFTLDAESCRRLIGTSCYGREKRTPPNAVDAINGHEGPFDTVVIMTGYNDYPANFDSAFDQVVTAARATGAEEILWLTYREGTAYTNPGNGTRQDEGFRQANQILRDKVATGAYPDVRIVDWNAYTAPTTGWFTKDGVHFTLAGAYGAADYISRQLAFGHREPCPAPWVPGGPVESPCSNPDLVPGTVDPMTLYAGNPNDIHCYDVGADHHINCRRDPKLNR
ncbi:MAG: SGNH/GDSL hydrolase family protein [Actinobacteria bacterium]|nr:SGNH/GDSL hydrolase family protein [Actinomycetota bacterium]